MVAEGLGATGPGAPRQVLVVTLDDDRLALPLESVQEVLPAMAYAPLPNLPEVVSGAVNLRGVPLPLLDLRTRLGRTRQTPDPDDHVVVCLVRDRAVGVWVDRVVGLTEVDPGDLVPREQIAAMPHVEGLAMLRDGLLLVCDVPSFLAVEEALRLDEALAVAVAEDGAS